MEARISGSLGKEGAGAQIPEPTEGKLGSDYHLLGKGGVQRPEL